MKFDLTFLLPTNDKFSFDKSPKFAMAKSCSSSLESNPVSHCEEADGGNDHHILGTSMSTTRSTSIPLPSSHVPRTHSEVQLSLDEEAAEQRDARMFYRLVNGIRERQQQQTFEVSAPHWQNSLDHSISRIVQARLAPIGQGENSLSGTPHPEDISTEKTNDFPQDASDNWSITGYEDDQPAPSTPHGIYQEVIEDHEEDYDEDEGLFEMDL